MKVTEKDPKYYTSMIIMKSKQLLWESYIPADVICALLTLIITYQIR